MFNFNKDSTFLFLKTGLDQTQSTVIGKVLKNKKKKKKKKRSIYLEGSIEIECNR